MRRAARALALALALAAPAVASAEDRKDPWEARIEGAYENLDNGYKDWRELMGQIAWRPRRGLALGGGGREYERFDLRDREAFALAYLPLAGRTTFHVEGAVSSTHQAIARDAILAELMQEVGDGWVLSAGGRQSRYDTGTVRGVTGMLEKYVGNYRLAYNIYLSQLDGGAWSPVHRLGASWYRDDLTFATVTGYGGREVSNILPQGLVTSDVRGASLAGGLGVSPTIGLTFELGWAKQGDFYTRRILRLGTRILF